MPEISACHDYDTRRAPVLYLASRSPRRRELLACIGVEHRVLAAEVDERALPGEVPTDYVRRVALAKAQAGWAQLRDTVPAGAFLVLAADTVVSIDGAILGKPRDCAAAAAMLRRLSGRAHEVLTAVVLLRAASEVPEGWHAHQALSRSRVTFRVLTDREIACYWATGEPHDKAGAYAIQGLGALFVSDLAGSHSGVMGLPLFETGQLLAQAGIDPLGHAPLSAAAAAGNLADMVQIR